MIEPEHLKTFFKHVFGQTQGWLCIATINPATRTFNEKFYSYPSQLTQIADEVVSKADRFNIYFCPQLFKSSGAGSRRKDNVSVVTCAWADLDGCHPDKLLVEPSVVIESSPERFQALWLLDDVMEPQKAEDLSRKIAYFHQKDGADLSGWDLTQLLRVPLTTNFKYASKPPVKAITVGTTEYKLEDFKEYPDFQRFSKEVVGDVPDVSNIDVGKLLEESRSFLNPMVYEYFEKTPRNGMWSHALRALEMFLLETGFSKEQVFAVAKASACNKYKRDRRPEADLWRDVSRAWQHHKDNEHTLVENPERLQPLLSVEERNRVRSFKPGFVERYIKWASEMSDAAKQYHQAAAFTCLSTVLCGSLTIPTSFGTIIPNLWFMILGDTTLTRKSTSMDMAVEMLEQVDDDSILATDGTIEGLMTILAMRPKQPSVFLRDEFSGLLDSMIKKDYMAGMPEMLTKLYDGKMMKRVLKKESFVVKDPRLIMYTGGIKSKITQILTTEHVSSGFLPRFIFITAESDVTRVRPIGPPMDVDTTERDNLAKELAEIKAHYNSSEPMRIGEEGLTLAVPREFKAVLSREAWIRYNELEMLLVKYGMDSEMPVVMTPVGDRLAKSILKAAVLMAASRQRNDDTKVLVTKDDILRAIRFGESWREYATEVISAVGVTGDERLIAKIEKEVMESGVAGVQYSTIMRRYRLSARQGREIMDTMTSRNLVSSKPVGKGLVYYVA